MQVTNILLTVGLCITLVSALPASVPPQLAPREISSSLLERLYLFSQYAAATYCSINTDSPGDKLSCPPGNCPLVEIADTETISEFTMIGDIDVPGFIVLDRTHRLVILCFRGSRTWSAWLLDLDIVPTDIDHLCAGCTVQTGWWASWRSVADNVTATLVDACARYPEYRLVIASHSSGGAIGMIAAVELRRAGHILDLYVFGAPRTGNLQLAEHLTAQGNGTSYRVTHTTDVVSQLPPRFLGYSDFSPEYWITSGNKDIVTERDITVVEGIDSNEGNAGQVGPIQFLQGIAAHSFYFGPIDLCRS